MRLEGLRVDKGYEERFDEAILTFRHQWVYCPTAQALVHLTPVPETLDLSALKRLIGDGHPPEIAHGIAMAQLDPMTCQPFRQVRTLRWVVAHGLVAGRLCIWLQLSCKLPTEVERERVGSHVSWLQPCLQTTNADVIPVE
jgi:hypothetical protein